MKSNTWIFNEIRAALCDKTFMKEVGLTRREVDKMAGEQSFRKMADEIASKQGPGGRISSVDVAAAAENCIPSMNKAPAGGWCSHCYDYVLSQLFPEMGEPEGAAECRKGRAYMLQILRGVYNYERESLPFDPTRDIRFLSEAEAEERGCTPEYIRMCRLVRARYVYEFMRIGVDTTPFNTLGHIGGVHYVAMFMARQMADAGIPIDLGLISGAAAGHDIGKYGCRKTEEKRIPYLHYFYTDRCYNRFDMPTIGHIAANHSTWDLELENLSAESLVLIYSDFRVKSGRDAAGSEQVHFFTLAEAYSVILNKLDNVDEAKKHRYQKVYEKLVDFENYLAEKGVTPVLPDDLSEQPTQPGTPKHRDVALMEGKDIVEQLKYAAVGHNLRLMSRFNVDSDFGNLIETARSEHDWKNMRTYIAILGEYSSYMTEKQKLMTLKFLYEQLADREGDIRSQSADIMGKIVGTFSEEYKKELPEGIPPQDYLENNLTLWDRYTEMILFPSHKFTDQHKKWISGCLHDFVSAVVLNCKTSCRYNYFDILEKYYVNDGYDEMTIMNLLNAAVELDVSICTDGFVRQVLDFAETCSGEFSSSVDIAVINVCKHFDQSFSDHEYRKALRKVLGMSGDEDEFDSNMPAMFLDDLKTNTPWIVKVANITLMLRHIDKTTDSGSILHLATHFANLVKVSETITVRKAAGNGLLSIIEKMPLEQRNELTVELFNGLEIGDYQFSKYIPDFLGIIMLYLPPKEMDESIDELKKSMESGSVQAASSAISTIGVMIENYDMYKGRFMETTDEFERRRFRLVGILIKAYAGYIQSNSQDAFWTMGTRIFSSRILSEVQKTKIFEHCCKKIMTLLLEKEEDELDFYNNAAVLNRIYRFISMHQAEEGAFHFEPKNKVAFFPGTFDPFSLGHKSIATTIRNKGFVVYLALDEFSWSKKTQPRLERRKIMSMSVADEDDIYIFPEDLPVNIANTGDLKRLSEIFSGRELYVAVGSDVVKNASSYKAEPSPHSIHSMNHIIFARETAEGGISSENTGQGRISGKIVNLTLRKFYEDISSTRIRENIDLNRDISNLIDAVAQNYIYDRNLYLREPAYKHVVQARELNISTYEHRRAEEMPEVMQELSHKGFSMSKIAGYVEKSGVRTLFIESGQRKKNIIAFAAAHKVETGRLLDEFGSLETAAHVRESATGNIAVIGALYAGTGRTVSNISQIVITEILTQLIEHDVTYVIYAPVDTEAKSNPRMLDALRHQGFVNIAPAKATEPILAVDMRSPVIIFRDVETVIKNPLNKNHNVLKAIDDAHNRLLRVLTDIYPGQLVLSFNTSEIHNRIINKVAEINNVSTIPDKNKVRGPYMSVPFGKALADVVVPNTVTKALHTEKYFDSDLNSFTIAESRYYSALENQVRTIKSFDRPVILIDDLLHKGYRMNILDPLMRENEIDMKEMIVGVMTGNARDFMRSRNRNVECAYFLPRISLWLNERDCYPFIGGDSVKGEQVDDSINLVMPYTAPGFIAGGSDAAVYAYSLACLENARDILRALEDEYQATYEKKLTLKRLGEVITYPRRPITGTGVSYDENLAPSVYVQNEINKMKRLKRLMMKGRK